MGALRVIAHNMAVTAQRTGRAERRLERGLRLELAHVGGYKVLSMSREDRAPGEQEIAICRDAFEAPETAQREDGERTVRLRWAAR